MVNSFSRKISNLQYSYSYALTINNDPKTTQKTIQPPLQNEILKYLYITPHATINEVANNIKNASLGGIKYNIQRLKTLGLLKRGGSDNGGYWKVLSENTEE